jgi:hypothetical protein
VRPHRIGRSVPVVEIACDTHLTGIRRPHSENRSVLARMSAEDVPQPFVPAFADQVKIYLTESKQRSGHAAGPSGATVVM